MYNMDICMPSAHSVDIWCSFNSRCHPLTSLYDCIYYHIPILLQVCAVAANDLGDLCFDNWIEHISTPFHMSVLYDWMARVKSPGAVHYQVRGYAVQHDHHSINYYCTRNSAIHCQSLMSSPICTMEFFYLS